MSKSLVRKSLELDELSLRSDKKKKKKRQDTLYDGALALIPARYRFTSEDDKAVVNTILGRSNSVTVHEVKKRLAQNDPVEENVKRLLSLKTNQLNSQISDKLLQRAVKKKHVKKQKKSKDKLNEPEETAFTEEDFKKFEQEYVE